MARGSTLLPIWVLVGILVLLCIVLMPAMERYQSLPNIPDYLTYHDRGALSEMNPDCMQNSNAFCMLTDGTSGKCVNGGVCTAELLDIDKTGSYVPKPYCTQPVSALSCPKFCNCLELKTGHHDPKCMPYCLSWYPKSDFQ